jgi:hypothetical protein
MIVTAEGSAQGRDMSGAIFWAPLSRPAFIRGTTASSVRARASLLVSTLLIFIAFPGD